MLDTTREIRHGHFFCGLGGGAKGFNKARPAIPGVKGKFRCVGGIDVDPAGIRDFDKLANVKGTVLDLFDMEQYLAFHGNMPPPGWREAGTADIHRAFGYERPHIIFLSAPCKGFSGLLSEGKSKTDKYQALNRLTLRGVWLMLEAYKDDPVELILFENVPRIATRGRKLLDQITALLRAYGYAVAETVYDCGELGNLAQSRKRFLLVARHMEKVPPFLYQPDKKPLRAVGEVLNRMPLPGDPAGGPMHRIPSLHWKTWIRLAFVEAGSDWRSLNKLAVENGVLRDYLLVPEARHSGMLGVNRWESHAGTITSRGLPNNGNFAVADPRKELYSAGYCVSGWDETTGAVAGESLPSNGKFAVADPRFEPSSAWHEGQAYGVRKWGESTSTIGAQTNPGQGAHVVADPRHTGPAKHSNEFRIIRFDQAAQAVTSAHGSGQAVADPRGGKDPAGLHGKYHVTSWAGPSRAVIGGEANGASVVADPRPAQREDYKQTKYRMTGFDEAAGAVIAASTTGNGAFAVADPRPGMSDRAKGDHYLTGGHYGVVPWDQHSYAVSAAASQDNGWWTVADPRPMPAPSDKLIARIISLDNTWHRPFTTLELAALQSLVDPEELFTLDGQSDQAWRERIGNAVPSDAATAIAEVMGETLLLAWAGEAFSLSAKPIWVRPVAVALAVQGA